jgi:hypothetical protein
MVYGSAVLNGLTLLSTPLPLRWQQKQARHPQTTCQHNVKHTFVYLLVFLVDTVAYCAVKWDKLTVNVKQILVVIA